MLKRVNKVGLAMLKRSSEFARNHKVLVTGATIGGLMTVANGVFADTLVTIDGVTGMPIFNASVVFSPLITTLISIVLAAAALWVTLAGVSYLKRFMTG